MLNQCLTAGCLLLVTVGQNRAFGWQEKLSRDGAYWVQTVTGSEAIDSGGKLRLSTRGRIVVNGEADSKEVRYTFTKKVRAKNEAAAREQLGQILVKASRSGDTTVLALVHGSDSGSKTDLVVRVPRTLREVAAETFGGPVEAADLDGGFQAQTGGGRIRIDRIKGSVFAKTAGGEIQLGSIEGAVKCISAGGAIRAGTIGKEAFFETAGGEIVVKEAGGQIHANTAGGSIEVGKSGGNVIANTGGGSIQVGSAAGRVQAVSAGGPIQVSGAAGAQCETGGGAIRMARVSGNFRASTAVGNVVAEILDHLSGDSFLGTGAGDITVFLPSNVAVTIQARSEGAWDARAIVSDFPGVAVRRDGSLVVAEGMLNGGGPVLRLAGTAGKIFIRKQQ